jgi:hypothetical protein
VVAVVQLALLVVNRAVAAALVGLELELVFL